MVILLISGGQVNNNIIHWGYQKGIYQHRIHIQTTIRIVERINLFICESDPEQDGS